MSHALERAIITTCAEARADDAVKGVVFTGGPGRSFCAGGDFKEVAAMDTPAKVEAWIDRLLALYIAVLEVDKPTVAAVDGYAIGIGFQLALCCDLRVATPAAQILMWELKHGVACTIGGYMLEVFLGRAWMLDLIYDCEPLDLDQAVRSRLVHHVTTPADLPGRAQALAERIAGYPEISLQKTKRAVNQRLIDGLRGVGQESKEAHTASFGARTAAAHFARVLHR